MQPLYPVPLSNFPSIAGATPFFDQDPLFAPYAREMQALVQPTSSTQPPDLSQAELSHLFTTSLDTLKRATAQHSRNMDGL